MERESTLGGEKIEFTTSVKIKSFRCLLVKLTICEQIKCADLTDGDVFYGSLNINHSKGTYYFVLDLQIIALHEIFVYGSDAKELFHFEGFDLRQCESPYRWTIPDNIIETLKVHDDVDIVVKMYDITTKDTVGAVSSKKPKCDCGIIKLFENGQCTDIVFKVSGEEIKAHKVILANKSKYFEVMFRSGLVEAQSDCIEVVEFKPNTIKAMLKYIYSSELEDESKDEDGKSSFYSNLLKAADKYQLDDLKKECEHILCTLISTENMEYLMSFALTHKVKNLQKKVAAFMSDRVIADTSYPLYFR